MRHFCTAFATATLLTPKALGTVTFFSDRNEWLAVAVEHSYIGFTEFPPFTTITTQYAEAGVTFTDGNDFIQATGSFPSDGRGLVSSDIPSLGTIHMTFSTPRTTIGFDYIGQLQVELFHEGALVYTSGLYHAGFFPFVGFESTAPFDAVVARDFAGSVVAIDNLLFGPPVPSPGALTAIITGTVLGSRRRRV